jgi:uncharacterized protein YodC (DUF2158 family)
MEPVQYNIDPSKPILIAIALVLLILLMQTCETVQSLNADVEVLQNENDKFTQKIYDDSVIIYSQNLNIISKNAMIKRLRATEKELRLKEVVEVVKIETKTKTKADVKLAEPVYVDSFPHLRLPLEFDKVDKWYSITGRINRLGFLQVDSFVTRGGLTYAIGDSVRKGIWNRMFQRGDKVVRLKIDNPNMMLTGMQNIYIRQEPKWYERKGFAFLFGAVFGGGLMLYAAK